MEQLLDAVHALGASAVGIAVSATFSQQQFATDLKLRYPLLSDWNREVSTAWGVSYDVWKGHQGVAKRSVFAVDAGGIIRYRWVTEDALVQPDYDELMTVLQRLADERRSGDSTR